MSDQWTKQNIPDLSGKIAVVTGANGGLGYETTLALAEKGATLVLACRNLDKANAAAERIRSTARDARLEIIHLDLADLASVHAFADEYKARYAALDLLINNAGIMIPPLTRTADGFEVQFGANHLGHYALTGLLLERLLATPNARVVNVSSAAHRMGPVRINFFNLNAERSYNAAAAYAQSKLANLLFTLELNRRLEQAGSDVIATAAHPGWTVTGLQKGFIHSISEMIGQRPAMGALPTLRAAVDADARRNDFYGPDGFMEVHGYPRKTLGSQASRDAATAKQLWEVSQQLTGIHYAWPEPA